MKYFQKIITLMLFACIQIGILAGMASANTGELVNNTILVTEITPWVKNCKCAKMVTGSNNVKHLEIAGDPDKTSKLCTGQSIHSRLYVCETGTIKELIQGVMQWIIQISLLLGVLATAALGVAWSISGGDNPEYKKKLKDWLVGLIIGLILIYGFQYILGIFGWVYQANI